MSWRKAQNAGAKQQAQNARRTTKETRVHKTFGGECAMSGCTDPATVRRGNHNYCRTHGQALD